MNDKYSKYKYIKYENGILDNVIDAVYVILLKNSKRKKNV